MANPCSVSGRLPAICWKMKVASDGAQRGTMPVVGCAQATIGQPPAGATPGGMMMTPETAIGFPSGEVER